MALHPGFPTSPYAILDPAERWFPADEALRETGMHKLMPPLVPNLRKEVKKWRESGYEEAVPTTRSLLRWWFETPHLIPGPDGVAVEFRYYFAQREALETILYLHDVVNARDKHDLMRYDASGAVSGNMFDETWRRYVVKMATGAGKTKVLALALAWSYFHKLYEPESDLSRNFLVIAPNIIVLDRVRKDFDGLKVFFEDPILPDNGFDGRNWRDDFQLTLHIQDEVRVSRPTGNIFLTNIHRVYSGNESVPSPDDEDGMDYFLGKRPTGATNDSKVDLGMIVRNIDELMVLNDEAHHIHDPRMAWFQSIKDIHNRLLQKGGALSMQIDVTATPKDANGSIFVQTVADYPLVEAIWQNVVKHPVLPDAASRAKLHDRQSAKFAEKYADYLNLGVLEWRKAYAEHERLGKKAILFVMTNDTNNCDDVAKYLEDTCPDLKGAVLIIHTNKSGEISESTSGKNLAELTRLREQANNIDSPESPFKAVVSVMMLKEGWDVRNVTTIVGLRAYAGQNKILPEQTLGRGLRKMYPGNIEEYVSVVGTQDFMAFVESIQAEGVELEHKPMGEGTRPKSPLVVEIDSENDKKNLDVLDIEIPVLTPRTYREYKNLADLDPASMGNVKVPYRQFSEEEQREIVFKDITTGEISHTTQLDTSGLIDANSVVGFFTRSIMSELKLFSGYDVLFGKVKAAIREHLFDRVVNLEDTNTLRNLSEPAVTQILMESLKKSVNALTVKDKGDAEIRDTIKLRNTRPFIAKDQGYLVPKRSVFNRIIGDRGFELDFASFLENCPEEDVVSYAKNYLAVGFKLDYVKADGDVSNYIPDFLVKLPMNRLAVVETKGREELDLPNKMARLKQWCGDLNQKQSKIAYYYVYVDQESFEKYRPKTFAQVLEGFREFQ